MTIDTKELRRLAQAATPGPWIGCGPSFGESLPKYLNEVAVDREGDEDDGYSVCTTPIGLEDQCSDDMAFIAAANPAAISELLDRLEAAEKERNAAVAMIKKLDRVPLAIEIVWYRKGFDILGENLSSFLREIQTELDELK